MRPGDERFVVVGETPYTWEREAIAFAFDQLRDRRDPFQGRALVELLAPASGSLYEIDLLVIGYSAIYLVEIKSHPGAIEGDHVDWTWVTPEGRRLSLDAPLRLANLKAKVLRSRLEKLLPDRVPWVQPLIFLSDPGVSIRLTPEGRTGVVDRAGLRDALVHGTFVGNERIPRYPIARQTMLDLVRAFEKLGLRARKGKLQVGDYRLGDLLAEGRLYQDYEATHIELPQLRRRARIYRVPEQISPEKKATCRRQADREVRLLQDVGPHPFVLKVHEYHTSGLQGPTILFESFDGGVPLDRFLRQHELNLTEQIEILRQVSDALAHCHRKSIIHGGLAPEAVLVRRGGDGRTIEAHLLNFQLGNSDAVSPTVHRTEMLTSPSAVYLAPELSADPSSGGPHSDLFSLGALAFLIFTGQPPASDLASREIALLRDKALDPWAVREDIPEAIRNAIVEATALIFASRIDDAAVWFECLLADLTAPSIEVEAPVSPLLAQKGARLPGELVVVGTLGHGGSARVIEVERGGQRHALKVSLGPEHDILLRAEGEVLSRLRHKAIVACRDILTIQGRTCLLLDLAGAMTLQRHLADEGSLDIDEAIRYGEELFDALHYLADEGLLHRDIKPANLGVGSRNKKARRLTLFDLSLVSVPLTDIQIGTAAYRDPYLPRRGHWDHAADRWSAAITLHEALTGVRPGWGAPGQPLVDPSDPELKLVLAAERFDPAARDRLVIFFKRALAADVADRFPTGREMRQSWAACFETRLSPQTNTAPAATSARDEQLTDEFPPLRPRDLARIHTDTLVGDLPLSLRAKNALDRAGITRMSELLALPNNRLSAIRGIGRKVAREIFDLRESWRTLRAAAVVPDSLEPCFPGFRGGDLYVVGAGLPLGLVVALQDAGFDTLASVAAAPRAQIENIAAKVGLAASELRRLLQERGDGDSGGEPPTLEGWLDLLLPAAQGKKRPWVLLVSQMLGLAAPFEGRSDVRSREVAAHAKVTRQRVSQVLGEAEEHWRKQAALPVLRILGLEILDELGGIAPIEQAADALANRLIHGAATDAQVRSQAAALWLILARVTAGDEQESSSIYTIRHHERPWIARSSAHVAILRELGEVADLLAERQPLAASGEVELALREAVKDTPLAGLDRARLADLAAAASHNAARSSRFEIYPRGLEAPRALELSAQVLTSDLSPEDVQSRVRARYPEAAPLPDGDALHTLLAPLGLRWEPVRGRYQRPEHEALPSTSMPHARAPTAMPGQHRARDEHAREARDFEDQLRVLLERGGLRVLQVNADWTIEATQALIRLIRWRHPDARVVHLDHLLIERMEALLRAQDADPGLVADTDALGQSNAFWENLTELAAEAAQQLLAELVPAEVPTLIVQPGLCARYDLQDFVRGLVERTTRSDSAAVLMLIPSLDEAGPPMIRGPGGTLPIPGLLPGHRAWVPRSWVRNDHNRAAD